MVSKGARQWGIRLYHEGLTLLFDPKLLCCCGAAEMSSLGLSVTLLFQIHNELLYTASHDGTLRIWDIRGICKRNKRRLKKERSVQVRSSQKGSLSRLFNNKVGCMVQQENGECEAVELV